MAECYSGLYEEGEVKHINSVWPSFLIHSCPTTAIPGILKIIDRNLAHQLI